MHAVSPPGGISIRIDQLGRRFAGGVTALDGVSLSIAAGDFVAILGPSGCGKSTLLRLVAGLDRPTAGTVSVGHHSEQPNDQTATGESPIVDYESSAGTPPFKQLRNKIAYVFQDAHLLRWRNVLRNVALPLELAGMSRAERRTRALAAIAQVGLLDAVDRHPGQLSGGMRMRVSLARAMVTDPQLLLLDEPFAALDEITRQRLDEQLRALWQRRGMTVVFVTHSTAEAVFLAQRAVVMSGRPGHIVLDRQIQLPADRTASLRSTPEFAGQTRDLYEALAGGSDDSNLIH